MKKGTKLNSIKTKIMFLLLLISIVPLALVTIVLMFQSISVLENKTEEAQIELSRTNGNMISLWLTQKVHALENVIEKHPEFLRGNKDEILPILKVLDASDAEVEYFRFVDESLTAHDTLDRVNDVSQFQNIQNAKNSLKLSISDILQAVTDGSNIIIIDVPLVNNKGDFKGIVQAALNPAEILNIVNRIQVEETGYAYLLAADGTYLLHPEVENIGKNISENLSTDSQGLFAEVVLQENEGSITYTGIDGIEMSTAYSTIEQTGWRLITSAPTNEVFKDIEEARNSAYIIILISIIAVIIIAFFAARVVIKPVFEITSIMQKVAKGDLTERLLVNGKDEIADLRRNINDMLDSFSLMVIKLAQSTEHVASASEELTAIAVDSTNTSKVITESVDEVVKGAESQYRSTEQVAIVMDEIALGIQQIAQSASVVTDSTQGVTKEVNLGNSEVKNAITQMNSIKLNVEKCTNEVQFLNEKSQEIENIVSMISEIANQTNLLALNASIEAARAGEHGKGFAVVATEVKKLAEQTSQATEDITSIIQLIVGATENASHSMSLGMEEVEKGVKQVQTVGSVFGTILEAINKVNSQVQEVSAATEQISASTEEVSASAQDVVDISKQSSSNLNEVSLSISNQNENMKEISASAESLSSMAMELQEMVSQFSVKEVSYESEIKG